MMIEQPNVNAITEAVVAQLVQVEAERDELRNLLLAMWTEAQENGLELASLERLNAVQHISALQSAETLKVSEDTVERQTLQMADQRDALSTMKTAHRASTTKAKRLQRATADTVERQILKMADQQDALSTMKAAHHESTTKANRLQRKTANTVERQTLQMADQQDALSHMTTERDKSDSRADRLQLAVTQGSLQMREKEELLALVLDVSVDGLLVYRAVTDDANAITDFECVLHNPAASALYGIAALQGQRLLALHPDARAQGLWDRYVAVMLTGEPFVGEYRHGLNGHARWFRVLAIKAAGGIAITLSDISQRKAMEAQILAQLEELKQADQMKNQFLGIISHELRTPINAITGFASILEDELVGPMSPAQQAYVGKILTGSDALLSLVNDLLDMSRIQAGKFTVETRPCEFPPIADHVLASLEARTGARIMVNGIPTDLPPILADEHRVSQVLTSLIANAIKFTPNDGTIAVRAYVSDGFLRCEVKDTGVGIAAENFLRLFDVFVQLDMTNTRSAGGTGLGLTLAKSLVEAQGGDMGLESQEGQGSTFWFTLPLAPEA